MQRRNIQVLFRLNEAEYRKLAEKVRKSGLKRETYIRSVLAGHELKEQPSVDFLAVLKQLQQINNNMNQIASKANTIGFIDTASYQENVDKLQDITAELLRAVMN